MKSALALFVTLALASAAPAQVIYQPVRYQVGPNIFYGGTNPAFRANPNVYVPPGLQAAPPVAGAGSGLPEASAAESFGPGSMDYAQSAPTYAQPTPHVFSDALPYQEASQYGYTPNDARNEAYANVPRIQYGRGPIMPAPAVTASAQTASTPSENAAPPADPRLKAIPLLDWAKVERTHNPDLYNAIITEARKYDPAAVDRFEQSFASEK